MKSNGRWLPVRTIAKSAPEADTRGLDWSTYSLPVGSGSPPLSILLRRLEPTPVAATRAVLLVPGANSSADTFTIPDGGLVAHLARAQADVWMLDWRASPLVLKPFLQSRPTRHDLQIERRAFTLDRIAAEDLPAALAFIRKRIRGCPLAVHGHCVGGAGVAMALARGLLEPFDIDRVVLSTLGLFYEVPWNTWIKAEDFLLESILLPNEKDDPPTCRDIDPHAPHLWPDVFKNAFKEWPAPWLPQGSSASDDFLKQLSFMVGQPYSRDKLAPGLDGPCVENIFGPLHLGLYLHLGQMVRRGYSAAFNVRDQIDRARLKRGRRARPAPRGDLDSSRFERYTITLVGAGDNGVWHRDSIDLMYEWLARNPRVRCEKHVFPEYNIQELYWAATAPSTTYDTFATGAGVQTAGVAKGRVA